MRRVTHAVPTQRMDHIVTYSDALHILSGGDSVGLSRALASVLGLVVTGC